MPLTETEYRDSGRVAVISMNRARGHNALSIELCDAILNELEAAIAAGARAVILRSSVDHFCVGADLHERRTMDGTAILQARTHSARLTAAIVQAPIPTIAVVHGFALGGGLELALACDYIIGETTAALGLPEAGIGIIPGGGGTQLLSRRIGWGAANRLLFTGDTIDAEEAGRVGLLDEIAAEGDGLARGIELATRMATRNPQSIRLIKEAIRRGAGTPIAVALEHEDRAWRIAAASEDYRQGLDAFRDKTSPPWA